MARHPQRIQDNHVKSITEVLDMMIWALVDNEDAIGIHPTVSSNRTSMILEIVVAPEDMQFVMGKDGRNIEAVKTIVHAMCTKLGIDCHIINVIEHRKEGSEETPRP